MLNATKAIQPDFDWERLHQLADGDTAFEVELLQIFLDDMDQGLAQLVNAIAHQETHTVEQVAHSIRGAAANLGAVSLAQTAAQLEQLGQPNQLALAEGLLGQLRSQGQVARHHLERMKEMSAD
ncbi:Hpt domain-containing protein [Romeria aff. gracilis LEGE 07310]|uniref:Hpt domain-containing protein n=1 Tax=Vasconcelosia minhoensis LEGE 07310 TaxID=915328 RepID=A0A8J7AR26_9CYAN|nr:Hpt domain-containing protein [Romeria gracilis]MBE9078856.1 Hpt domain-containing protein [Romeria aff. gracilis LEGE 07310]